MGLSITNILQQQRDFFATGKTKDINFRLAQLQKLKDAIASYQRQIVDAVKRDLGRPEYEAYFEIASVSEVSYAMKHLKSWVKPKKVPVSFEQWPASAKIYPEPKGVVLIIAPWNYPFQLMISPLVG
ncbi:MAG: aldehyde dehydrogenase family protein, partial [Microcoleaceae cyanobacterium]